MDSYDTLRLPAIKIDSTMLERDYRAREINKSIQGFRKNSEIWPELNITLYDELCWLRARDQVTWDNLRLVSPDIRKKLGNVCKEILLKHIQDVSEYIERAEKWIDFYYTLRNYERAQDRYIQEKEQARQDKQRVQQDKQYQENYRLANLQNQSGIYFIRDVHGLVEIGRSECLKSRCQSHACSNSHPLELIAVILTENCYSGESEAHYKYCDYRFSGEWHRLPENIVENIIGEMSADEQIVCDRINDSLKCRHVSYHRADSANSPEEHAETAAKV